MKHPSDRNIHRPKHLLLDDQIYFITGRTYFDYSHLKKRKIKNYFLEKAGEISEKYMVDIKAWVVLDNHYHLLVNFEKGRLLPKFIKHLHGSTAHLIKKQRHEPNFVKLFFEGLTPWQKREWEKHVNRLKSVNPRRSNKMNFVTPSPIGVTNFSSLLQIKPPPVWYQYLDHIIRDEKDLYKHLNYIHQNPVKHGLVKKMRDYKFSSFNNWLKEKGREWMADCFTKYPIIDFEPTGGF